MSLVKEENLFHSYGENLRKKNAPLADRMRPRSLDEFIGQKHIIGKGRLLRRAIQIDQLSSIIFYGPPGTGKTTLARIIANTTKANFISLNAVLAGVKEIRDAIDTAQQYLSLYGRRTILFIDEVHRFNKSQQDALLPHVENGLIILIGATTENPYFEVNKALVSRSRIFQLLPLTDSDIKEIVQMAMNDSERGYGNKKIKIDEDALEHLVKTASGDARCALNALELAVETTPPNENGEIHLTRAVIEDSIQQKAVLYDKDGDVHYDTISAFIKSIRGSDPDAALYWLARMIYAGEDPRFIFRRMLILASEDIGMADPNALVFVNSAAQAFEYVGMPEGRFHLANACIYLATAPKSNSAMGFFDALKVVSEQSDDIPLHLRDANRDGEGFGHGAGYLYPHAYKDHWVAQQYLPSSLQGKIFYQPSDQGYEKNIAMKVQKLREAQLESMKNFEEDISSTNIDEKHQWYERSTGERSRILEKIRDEIFLLSKINPSDVVLDLNGGSGMNTFELCRIIKDGGVWSFVYSEDAYLTIKKLSENLNTLSKPVLIKTKIDNFERDLQSVAGEHFLFDKIIGRGILVKVKNKVLFITRILNLLKEDGTLVIGEFIPALSQKLSELINVTSDNKELLKMLQQCEDDMRNDPDDPAFNWNPTLLKDEFNKNYNLQVMITTKKFYEKREIRPQEIEFYFRTENKNSERLSLGERWVKKYDKESLEKIKALLHKELSFNTVNWYFECMFLQIRKKK
ncbi:MAG: AAA family ATPase [Chitinispirillaceae bacterium]|nr:AAA family ATPase [Chitinispirillaceae bacterium]